MTFPNSFYLLALGGGLLTTFLTVPLWRKWSYASGLVDDPGHRKIHERPIALAGGLAVLAGLMAPLLLGALWVSSAPQLAPEPGEGPASWTAAAARNPIGALGYGFSRRS